MQKLMILGAALALGTVSVLPATQALNIGGEAHAMRDGERQRAGNRSGRRNPDKARSAAREGRAKAISGPQRRAARNREERAEPRTNRTRFEPRFGRVRDREFRRRPIRAPRLRRNFRHSRFCVRPARIKRRLYRQGWDVLAFHRTGAHFNARVRNRHGHRYALSLDGCNGHILSQHSLEKRRRRGIKKVFHKIRRTFKKIF